MHPRRDTLYTMFWSAHNMSPSFKKMCPYIFHLSERMRALGGSLVLWAPLSSASEWLEVPRELSLLTNKDLATNRDGSSPIGAKSLRLPESGKQLFLTQERKNKRG